MYNIEEFGEGSLEHGEVYNIIWTSTESGVLVNLLNVLYRASISAKIRGEVRKYTFDYCREML